MVLRIGLPLLVLVTISKALNSDRWIASDTSIVFTPLATSTLIPCSCNVFAGYCSCNGTSYDIDNGLTRCAYTTTTRASAVDRDGPKTATGSLSSELGWTSVFTAAHECLELQRLPDVGFRGNRFKYSPCFYNNISNRLQFYERR